LRWRRFLLTTYNTLVELDMDLRENHIEHILRDITSLSHLYDTFKQNSKQVRRAFQDLFLNRYDTFIQAQKKLEENKVTIAKHTNNMKIAEGTLLKLNEIMTKTPPSSENFPLLQSKIKKARTVASDAIHYKRILEDENLKLARLIEMIIQQNEKPFATEFIGRAKHFDHRIIALLNKVAYAFDASLWEKARHSQRINHYFKESTIKGKLSSLTYLKYYLKSLNIEKLSEEQRSLFSLIPYLESLHRRSLLYFSAEIENAMRFKTVVASIDKHLDVETTLSYEKAVESISKNLPNLIFIDQQLPELKILLKRLKIMGVIETIVLVLVVKQASETFLEQVKKIHINYLLPTEGSNLAFTHTLTRILEET
ncbi:MAG: hypothetical protein M0P91_11020, partial [Sulfuricurvum sp.]|uniref:hypothetical protein n=1 Tax=Sulfuricurvum sp. TaxID=2025608 RepID=UPI0025D6E796